MKKKTKLNKKKLTVGELKTWLDGYCSAHGDGWSPTAEQWKLIQDKIFSLDEGGGSVEAGYAQPSYPSQNPPRAAPSAAPVNLPPQFPSGLDNSAPRPAAPVESNVVGLSNRPGVINKDGKLITPNKDEAGGPSDFA